MVAIFSIIVALGFSIFCVVKVFNVKNTKNESQKITIDDIPPTIHLSGAEFYYIDGSIANYKEIGYSATDNKDGDLTSEVETSFTLDDNGNYNIDYVVSDSSGNIGYAHRVVKIGRNEEAVGTVYLTFDDGPSKLTPKYLDVLKENKVNATFFTNGFSDEDEWKIDLIKRESKEGNRVAMHGMSHEYADIYVSPEAIENNFYIQRGLLLDYLGINTKIMRFPGGSSNMVSRKYCKGIMTRVTKTFTEKGYHYVDWNVDSNDAGEDVDSSEKIFENVLAQVRPNKDNVILMHDASDHEATLEALPKVIKALKKMGYEFRVVDNSVSVQHHIFN